MIHDNHGKCRNMGENWKHILSPVFNSDDNIIFSHVRRRPDNFFLAYVYAIIRQPHLFWRFQTPDPSIFGVLADFSGVPDAKTPANGSPAVKWHINLGGIKCLALHRPVTKGGTGGPCTPVKRQCPHQKWLKNWSFYTQTLVRDSETTLWFIQLPPSDMLCYY